MAWTKLAKNLVESSKLGKQTSVKISKKTLSKKNPGSFLSKGAENRRIFADRPTCNGRPFPWLLEKPWQMCCNMYVCTESKACKIDIQSTSVESQNFDVLLTGVCYRFCFSWIPALKLGKIILNVWSNICRNCVLKIRGLSHTSQNVILVVFKKQTGIYFLKTVKHARNGIQGSSELLAID